MELEDFEDELDHIAMSGTPAQRVAALQKRIGDFSPGEVGRAAFLMSLAGHLDLVDDHDGAREASLAAIADGGPTNLDPRCGLLMTELHAGQQERADEILAELLARVREGKLGVVECEWIAGSLEEAGRFRQALRWYTIPLRDIDPDDIDEIDSIALHGRYRVRRELDLPLDAYDDARDLLMRLNDETT